MRRALAIACVFAVAGMVSLPVHAQTTAADKPIVLDRVIAIINGTVLLQSDVDEEMRFAMLEPLRVLPGQNTPRRGAQRLISRTLILEQMNEQQQPLTASGPEVDKALDELRKQLPACANYHCSTDEGWAAFLNANGLTPQEVKERWSQRLAILHFIDIRFRSGLRISDSEIEQYYQKTLVPALEKTHETPPKLQDVSSRIQEILLQQHVTNLMQDWLKSLRDQGTVQILDPAYGESSGEEDEE